MTSNFIYILIAILIFIYLYFEIDKKSKEYSVTECSVDDITIELNSSIIKMNRDKVINHIHMLKGNVTAISKRMAKLTNVGVNMLNKAINDVANDLNSFKSDNDFSDIKLQFGSHDDHHILGNKLYNDAGIRSDIDDIQYEKFKLLNTILDLEILILLLQNENNEGRVRLTNLHHLIRLGSTLTNGKDYLSYDSIFGVNESKLLGFTIDDENTYNSFYTNNFGVNTRVLQPKVHKVDKSQDVDNGFGTLKYDGESFVNDNTTPVYEGYLQQTLMPKDELSQSYNTQLLGDSGLTALVKRNGIPNYIPFCNIDKIIGDDKKRKAHLVDSDARQCLRNDYTF